MNRAKALKPEPSARMDREDRLAYIKEQKAKLGLSNKFLLKSSKRVVSDAQLKKDMPSLEFNKLHNFDTYHLFQPHEMTWSTHEFNKEEKMKWLEETQGQRLEENVMASIMEDLKYKSAKMKVLKEDFPEKYQDEELKSAEQMMEELLEGNEKSTKNTPGKSGLTDEIEMRLQ